MALSSPILSETGRKRCFRRWNPCPLENARVLRPGFSDFLVAERAVRAYGGGDDAVGYVNHADRYMLLVRARRL